MDIKELWYALFLCIIKEIPADESLRLMGYYRQERNNKK